MNPLIELVQMLEWAEFLINEAGRIPSRGNDSGLTPGEFARERAEWLAHYEKMMVDRNFPNSA